MAAHLFEWPAWYILCSFYKVRNQGHAFREWKVFSGMWSQAYLSVCKDQFLLVTASKRWTLNLRFPHSMSQWIKTWRVQTTFNKLPLLKFSPLMSLSYVGHIIHLFACLINHVHKHYVSVCYIMYVRNVFLNVYSIFHSILGKLTQEMLLDYGDG